MRWAGVVAIGRQELGARCREGDQGTGASGPPLPAALAAQAQGRLGARFQAAVPDGLATARALTELVVLQAGEGGGDLAQPRSSAIAVGCQHALLLECVHAGHPSDGEVEIHGPRAFGGAADHALELAAEGLEVGAQLRQPLLGQLVGGVQDGRQAP